MRSLEWTTYLVIFGPFGVSLLVYFIMNGGVPKKGEGRHRPWCIARDRGVFGLQILFVSRTQRACSKWRNAHRHDDEAALLYLLSLSEVNRENANTMAMVEFWAALDDLSSRGYVLLPPPTAEPTPEEVTRDSGGMKFWSTPPRGTTKVGRHA